MPNLITINDTQIEQLTYHEQPVVTFEMIADVHGVPVSNVQKSFQRHQDRFTAEKHYYRINAEESQRCGLRVQTGQHGALLFTRHGYLLLVKPMKDDKAWNVQERMIDEYFAMQTALQALPTVPQVKDPKLQMLIEAVVRMDSLEQQLATQHEALIANQHATIQAQELALRALQSQTWITLRQYALVYDLHHQLPPKQQQDYARWLVGYCAERNIPIYKAQTAHTAWKEENTYHIGTIQETLPGWLLRHDAQQPIALVPHAKQPGASA